MNPESFFEFIVEMPNHQDLDWWSATRRGNVNYVVDYERGCLRIGVHLDDIDDVLARGV